MSTDASNQPVTLSYDGRFHEIALLSLRVSLLSLVTLSVYRFWAKTRVRRYFWSRIKLNGEALEYSGTGRELFVSFLKVAALLVVALLLGDLLKWSFAGSSTALTMIAVIQSFIVVILYALAVYYARRYRLTRTQWRGIRFNLVGSPARFVRLNVLYLLLTAYSFGLCYPLWSVATKRYLLAHSWVGDRPVRCDVKMAWLLLRWVIAWGIFAGTIVGSISYFRDDLAQFRAEVIAYKGAAPARVLWAYFGVVSAIAVLYLPIGVWYRLAEAKALVRGLAIDGLSCDISLGLGSSASLLLQVIGAWCLVIGLCGIVVEADFVLQRSFAAPSKILGVGTVLCIGALIFVGSGLTTRVILWHGLLKRLFATLTIGGEVDLAGIGQTYSPVPIGGEGLLEALDLGG